MDQHKPLRENYKKKQRKAVLKLISLLLVVATLIATAAWSWFRDPDSAHATANGLGITLKSQNLLLSVDDGATFSSGINLSEMLVDLDMVPVTGMGNADGVKNYLFVPVSSYNSTGQTSLNTNVAWPEAVPNRDYIYLKVIFKTEFPAAIYIGSGTAVTTDCDEKGNSFTGKNAVNVSRYGDFSRDAIVGALRMSVSESNKEDQLRFLWIPRPDVELATSESGKYMLSTGLTTNNLWGGKHEFFDINRNEDFREDCAVSPSVFRATAKGTDGANEKTKIGDTVYDSSMTTGESSPVYTCTSYIKIWIEGRDAEADRALSRGRFKFNLNFVALELEQPG